MLTRIGALIEFKVSQRKMKCGRSSRSYPLNRQVGSISFWLKADLVDWNRYDPVSNFSFTGTLVISLTDLKGIPRTGCIFPGILLFVQILQIFVYTGGSGLGLMISE